MQSLSVWVRGFQPPQDLPISGERFENFFLDFEAKYGFHDMYSGGFFPPLKNMKKCGHTGHALFGATAIWTSTSGGTWKHGADV